MKFTFDPNELTKEKSLWDIYLSSRKIRTSKFNQFVLISIVLISGCYVLFIESDISIVLSKSRELSELGLNYSISILGFLIAGFTIFATLTKPTLLLKMMDKTHKGSKLTYLKYNYFVFMRVFIFYLSISSMFFFVILFCGTNGIVPKVVSLIPEANIIKPNLIKISYICLNTSVAFLVLLLKGFIYNVYSITMNNLRWEHYELTCKQRIRLNPGSTDSNNVKE